MAFKRSSGVLLHPTSLPDCSGIGTIGKQAYKFVDWLAEAGQSLWQVLPLGPTGYGDSPYASFSTYAGQPLIIDLDELKDAGLLTGDDILPPDYIKSNGDINYGAVVFWKKPILRKAAANFMNKKDHPFRKEYDEFVKANSYWLDEYALFMDIKNYYDEKAQQDNLSGCMWSNYWPKDLALHQEKAVKDWASSHKGSIEIEKIIQFFFFHQWNALKAYANSKGIHIIGDIPIFVAPDSVDVWANQKLFLLNSEGVPTFVSGVPPDYFSATGQLWGNPLYNWKEMAKDDYAWWISRIKGVLNMVDYIRIDHFRGFEAYWAIPFGEETAINGKWEKGPDHALFNAIKKQLGELPILAEDLGLITEEVKALRDDFNLPGMKILQFAFDANEAGKDGMVNTFLPHNYTPNSLVYTGTHDNDTLRGWIDKASDKELNLIQEYIGKNGLSKDELVKEMVRLAMSSVSVFAVIPMQDLLGIGSEGRMNTPSTTGTNWAWRMQPTDFNADIAKWMRRLSALYARNSVGL